MKHVWTDYWWLTIIGASIAIGVWSRTEGGWEEDRNDVHAAPADQQVRWHIRHIRQDVRLIVAYLGLIICLLAAILAELYSR
jgi:hypothetical protein